MQVHKETIDKIPNALPNRNNVDIEIYGMEGIPEADLKQHEKSKGSFSSESSTSTVRPTLTGPLAVPKIPIIPSATTATSSVLPIPIPGAIPNVAPFMPGLIHGMLPYGVPNPPPVAGQLPSTQFPAGVMPTGVVPSYPPAMPAPMISNPQANILPMPPLPSTSTIPTSTTVSSSTVPEPIVPKPLFPAAVAVPSATNSVLPGASNSVPSQTVVPSIAQPMPQVAKIVTTIGNSRIIHPEEDLSLEELRARQPRYKLQESNLNNVSQTIPPQPPISSTITANPLTLKPPHPQTMPPIGGLGLHLPPPPPPMPHPSQIRASFGPPPNAPFPQNYRTAY